MGRWGWSDSVAPLCRKRLRRTQRDCRYCKRRIRTESGWNNRAVECNETIVNGVGHACREYAAVLVDNAGRARVTHCATAERMHSCERPTLILEQPGQFRRKYFPYGIGNDASACIFSEVRKRLNLCVEQW